MRIMLRKNVFHVTVSWLVGNFRLDKFRQQRQRFLPAQVASLRRDNVGDAFLYDA